MPPIIIAGLRGRNGTDSPLALEDWATCASVNVDHDGTSLAIRRAGSEALGVTFSSGGPFTGGIPSLFRHVPGTNETAAELWAIDSGTGLVGRLAASTQWTAPTVSDAVAQAIDTSAASLGGKFWLTYRSGTLNRSFVWDGTSVRRRGFATPAVPTLLTNGGSGLTFTRYYRVRWVHISGSDRVRQSEPSPSATVTITDDASLRVTRPTAASEGETHWAVEYADADAGPWYEVTTVAIATTFYDDNDAAVDTTLDLSDDDGLHMPPPAWKVNVKAGGRLLCAGCHQTAAGSSFIPLNNEVYWTPIEGALDVGDLERQPVSHRVVLDHPVNAISEALNGLHYAFGYRGISLLVPEGTGETAFSRITERSDLGCIRQQTLVMADDEMGQAALYFLSHRGPYRITSRGMQYLGTDIEDLWATVNLDAASLVAHGMYDADTHTIYYWVATGDAIYPNARWRFFTQLGRSEGDEVRGGWVTDDSTTVVNAAASVAFSQTVGASMSSVLGPYFGSTLGPLIYQGNTGTDDADEDYQAYVDTKEYAPAGLGRNCSIGEPHVVAEANASAVLAVTAHTDFGRETSDGGTVSLAAEMAETHVQRKVDGVQASGIGTVRFRIGDPADADPGFTSVQAVMVPVTPVDPR
jgi:hypothetical protein